MSDTFTDRVVLWGLSTVHAFRPDRVVRTHVRTEFAASIYSALVRVPFAALVVLHDGGVNCTLISAVTMGAQCSILAQTSSLATASGGSDVCRLGKPGLKPSTVYLARVGNKLQRELSSTMHDFFSFKSKLPVRLNNGSTDSKRPKSGYGPALGLGTWYRYIAHQILLPLGVRNALYLDADTCVVGDVAPLFSANDSAAIVAARRERDEWLLRKWIRARAVNFKEVERLFGFHLGNSRVFTRTFNAGVLLLNLGPYCQHGIWERIQMLAHHHATVERLFGPLDTTREINDNNAIEIVSFNSNHFVGAEYNCRLPSSYRGLTTKGGRRCRLRHIHEDSPWLLPNRRGSKQASCATLTANKARELSVAHRNPEHKQPSQARV